MFGSDPLEELVLPNGTHVEEHDLVTEGDVLVGGQSTIQLGIRGGGLVAGERVTFEGDLEADGDCRLDMWCEVDGNVLVGSDAYLGERVHITGQLIVSGDLDIGDDVEIDRGFEANGWIVIRNPMPTIVFLFVYLSHLLRIGEEEAASDVASEFFSDENDAEPATIPRGAHVSDDAWRVSTPAVIGDNCRLHGNIRAAEIEVGTETEVFGSLRAKGPIHVGRGTVIHGDVTTRNGNVVVTPGAHIRGDISCERCALSEAAEVEGTIRAREGITIEDAPDPIEDSSEIGHDESVNDGREGGSDADSDRYSDGSEHVDAPIPAIVRLGDGTLPRPESLDIGESKLTPDARSSEPLDEERTVSAIVSIDEATYDWEGIDDGRASRNGEANDVSAVVSDQSDS